MAYSGRKARIKHDPDGDGGAGMTLLAGVKTEGFALNNEPVDITDKDANGWRTLLNDVGVKSVEITCSGIVKDDKLLELGHGAGPETAIQRFIYDMPDIGAFAGDYMITSFSLGAPAEAEQTFEATLQSSGEITWTAAAASA